LEVHSFSQFFDFIYISPSSEGVTKVSVQVLEELIEGFLLKFVIFAVLRKALSATDLMAKFRLEKM
jgi:hypothetical protein